MLSVEGLGCRVQGSGPLNSDMVAEKARVSAVDADASGVVMLRDEAVKPPRPRGRTPGERRMGVGMTGADGVLDEMVMRGLSPGVPGRGVGFYGLGFWAVGVWLYGLGFWVVAWLWVLGCWFMASGLLVYGVLVVGRAFGGEFEEGGRGDADGDPEERLQLVPGLGFWVLLFMFHGVCC